MRLKVISCEIFFREVCAMAARSVNQVDLAFLPKGLHDLGAEEMRRRVQAALEAVDESRCDAVAMGYGLCNNGLHGLVARGRPVVIPRAHDCITLFFGSRKAYADYFWAHPGTYFLTSGWIERGEEKGELRQLSIQRKTGMDLSYEELVAKYGEDNAAFLAETLGGSGSHYERIAWIEMGVEPDGRFERHAREEAAQRGWTFDHQRGDLTLLRRLLDGPWDEDFLVLQPGQRAVATHDDGLLRAEPAE